MGSYPGMSDNLSVITSLCDQVHRMSSFGDDPFADCAFIYGDLFCDSCGVDVMLPEGASYADDGWERLISKRARESGWLVEWHEAEDDWTIMCPTCRRDQSS